VAEKDNGADGRLDELYREHPDRFVAGRNQLARELRAGGSREEAERIGKLRRPSVAAWLINRTALSSPKRLEEFAEASRRLEEAQRRALDGDEHAVADWRVAAAAQRDANGAVVETAARLARDSDHPPNPRVLELVAETLQAAAVDADLRERVMRGRLEREQAATTLGTPAVAPAGRRDRSMAKRRDVAQARRELERLRQELEETAEREAQVRESVERTTATLRAEKARLAETRRETAKLRRRIDAAERRAK
jgi:hypothetical protein